MSTAASRSKSSASPLWILGMVLVITALLVVYVVDTPSSTLLKPGSVAPPIRALGWLHGGPVSEEQLSGNVVVIDCFASW